MKIAGIEIKQPKDNLKSISIAPEDASDGAMVINSGTYYGWVIDTTQDFVNEVDQINKYREIATHPELEVAIDEIVNQAIVVGKNLNSVSLDLSNVDEKILPKATQEKLRAEFDTIVNMLNFNKIGQDIFRRWYVDGRIVYEKVIDVERAELGIQKLKYIDPRKIKKVREVKKEIDPETRVEVVAGVKEYFLYDEQGISAARTNHGAKIAKDTIAHVTSGLMDTKRGIVIGFLNKAIRPLNMLRMVEDALVIYRLSRAPERRVFYIDIGDMQIDKGEEYVKKIMNNYRNKIVYDAATGEIKDSRKHQAIIEDYWMPRREGQRGTEIDTLAGGQNLGDIEDIRYFEKKLYKALGIPVSRLETETLFNSGRATEITREELRFHDFVNRLRQRFALLFEDLLKTQVLLKGIISIVEWEKIRSQIFFDYQEDNNFKEMQQIEIMRERADTLNVMRDLVGTYYSREWIYKKVLQMSEEEIEEEKKRIKAEKKEFDSQQDMMPGMGGAPQFGNQNNFGGNNETPPDDAGNDSGFNPNFQ